MHQSLVSEASAWTTAKKQGTIPQTVYRPKNILVAAIPRAEGAEQTASVIPTPRLLILARLTLAGGVAELGYDRSELPCLPGLPLPRTGVHWE